MSSTWLRTSNLLYPLMGSSEPFGTLSERTILFRVVLCATGYVALFGIGVGFDLEDVVVADVEGIDLEVVEHVVEVESDVAVEDIAEIEDEVVVADVVLEGDEVLVKDEFVMTEGSV